MVRPLNDRYLAGVCAALGSATRTDPILWRVLLAVLVLFGGIGLVVYLIGWILIPSEGDTASPIEATLGRGQSATSPTVVMVIGIAIGITLLMTIVSDSKAGVFGLLVIAGVAVWLARRNGEVPASGMPPTASPATSPRPSPAASLDEPYGDVTRKAGTEPDHAPTVVLPGVGLPGIGLPPTTGPQTSGLPHPPHLLRPPLTPHGPFGGEPHADVSGSSYPPPPQYPGYGTALAAPKPRRPRERSVLGRATFSVLCLALGVLVAIDLSGVSVTASAYVGLALGVVGIGLLIGTWYGRARWLIPVGIILAITLASAAASEHWDGDSRSELTFAPASVSVIEPSYNVDVGNMTLDLTQVDFTDAAVTIETTVGVGNLTILLPPTVDAEVTAIISVGGADVFGNSWGGVGDNRHVVRNLGTDGEGGGNLIISARIEAGHLEVSR
ncbi:MAG: PspC domain-containing protein [Micromonosporaceae bacterium]|nr:PspC domain-containing protein [Micromonosporaceae bacterium]